MDNFEKVLRIGTTNTYGKRAMSVYIKIAFKNGDLSITGVEGPLPSGNALGSCGQINAHMNECYIHTLNYAKGWNASKLRKLLDIWRKWHLNDMKAGCEHQRDLKWEDARIPINELPKSHANKDKDGIIATWVTEEEHPKRRCTFGCS